MKLIILGAPGAGKGTQAEILSDRLNVPAISTGAIIREEIKNQTPFGVEAKTYIDDGQLLPDDMVNKMLLNRIAEDDCKDGYILDGFPRTVSQAEFLDANGVDIDRALSLEVEDEVIIERLSGRRECISCRAPYHIKNNPPKKEGICDKCGAPLIKREDDNEKTVLSRLEVYHEKTAPLKEYFAGTGKLKTVQSADSIEKTTDNVIAVLQSL